MLVKNDVEELAMRDPIQNVHIDSFSVLIGRYVISSEELH